MKGILKIAFKLLVNDKGKFAALLMGITFAVFLMVMMTSIFSGVLRSASSVVINIGAKIWVMDPAVTSVANSIPMPDFVQDAVRSIDGVKFAVPLYSGAATLRLANGIYQSVSILGLDDTSLLGRPELLEGNIADIFAENGFFVVKDSEINKLNNPLIGTTFELNEHRGVIVGIAKVAAMVCLVCLRFIQLTIVPYNIFPALALLRPMYSLNLKALRQFSISRMRLKKWVMSQ